MKTVKVVLLASPGFVKDDFFTYLKTESVRNNERSLIEQANRNKFVLCRNLSERSGVPSEAECDAKWSAMRSEASGERAL